LPWALLCGAAWPTGVDCSIGHCGLLERWCWPEPLHPEQLGLLPPSGVELDQHCQLRVAAIELSSHQLEEVCYRRPRGIRDLGSRNVD
jgi:hypothetical protein